MRRGGEEIRTASVEHSGWGSLENHRNRNGRIMELLLQDSAGQSLSLQVAEVATAYNWACLPTSEGATGGTVALVELWDEMPEIGRALQTKTKNKTTMMSISAYRK